MAAAGVSQAALGAVRRLGPSAMAGVRRGGLVLALPGAPAFASTAAPALARAASSAAAAGQAKGSFPDYPRFETLDDMAAWDLPLEGQLSSSSAEPQTLKQVYPERPMSKHERSLFVTAGETEKLPQLKDHGYRFLTAPEVLDGRSEAVKRSMSTFTASIPELRTFRKSELIRKFRTHTYDTGSARVQGETDCVPGWGRALVAVSTPLPAAAGFPPDRPPPQPTSLFQSLV